MSEVVKRQSLAPGQTMFHPRIWSILCTDGRAHVCMGCRGGKEGVRTRDEVALPRSHRSTGGPDSTVPT